MSTLRLPAVACGLLFAVIPCGTRAAEISHQNAALKGDEKLLQVLNRFTYGPRPGDLEHIRAIGIQAWLDQQLAPQTIDDSALDRLLADFPAMQLPLKDLMQQFPNQQVIRQEIKGKAARPAGEAEKAIYSDSESRYKAKLASKNAAATVAEEDGAPGNEPLPQSILALAALSSEKRFSALCRFTPAQLKILRQSARPEERLQLIAGFTPRQVEALAAFASPAAVIAAEDVQTKLLRDIYSERQLNEIMVDFWLNHFNVYLKKSQDAPYYIAAFARDSIRPYALGRFENLLVATATSPAMLNYLDNSSSIGPHSQFATRPFASKNNKGLNENYARELMELHTLGVNGGYSQADVTEVAKVFTGWNVGSPEHDGIAAQAQFEASRHEPGNKVVLGVAVKENGEREGLQVLHILATSPATARFVSTKLAVRFVTDDPPRPLVDRMAKTFLDTHGDIRKVLLAMVDSPEFFNRASYRAKVKTPQDFVVSAVRASGAEVQSAGALANVVAELGMPVYGMQTPNGYSMKADPWNSSASLIARLNFSLALASDRITGIHADWETLLKTRSPGEQEHSPSSGPEFKESLLEARLLHVEVSDRTRSAILTQLNADPAQQRASLQQVAVEDRKRDPFAAFAIQERAGRTPVSDPQAALAAGLLFGSPEFQRR